MSSKSDPRAEIKKALGLFDLSYAWLAERVGTSKQNVHNWLRDENPASPSDSEMWTRMLEAIPQFDVDRPRLPVSFKRPLIPVAGLVPAGEWGAPLDSEEFIEVDAKFESPKRFAAYVVGDSCYPCLVPGDLTIWNMDNNPMYGRIVLAQRKGDHGCTVKELAYDEERMRPILRPINPAHGEPADGDGWGVIARLVGVIRDDDGVEKTWYSPKGLTRKHFD